MPKLDRPPQFKLRWQETTEDHVISLEWSPNGSMVATAAVSGPITIVDGKTGAVKQKLAGHGFGTAEISWHHDHQRLASAGQDGKVRVWDITSGKELACLEGGSAWVEHVQWGGPKGKHLVAAAGKKLRLWNSYYELVQSYPDQPKTIGDLIWGAKGKEFITGGYGGVTFWTLDQTEPKKSFEWKGAVLKLALSPDGKYLVGGAQESSVHFWLTKTGADLEMSGYPTKIRELAWDPDSRYLATGGGELVTVWDCSGDGPAGTTPKQLALHTVPITALAWQHRGALVASGCGEGTIALWYPGGKNRHLGFGSHEEGISQLSWSPGDGLLAVGGEQGMIAVYGV